MAREFPRYFDYASTTPVDPEVMKAMDPFFFGNFGNPASPHSIGRQASKALEESRETVARFIGAKPDEIIFTSSATESNNQAVIGSARAMNEKGNHIIVSAVEHHSVERPAEFLRQEGFQVTFVGVDPDGVVDPEAVRKAITSKTVLIAVLQASNEIGTVQPSAEIGKIAREHKIPFLVDAVQTVGHIPVQVNDFNADFLSMSAHKFYGPKGIGALYVRKGMRLSSLLLGGDQERGRRASTVNVAGAVGMARALQICKDRMKSEIDAQSKWRDQLLMEIFKKIDGVRINGHRTQRLPNNAHFSFEKVEGEALLLSLDTAGIAASMGSACTAGSMEPSHVLRAIGLPDELAFGSLRLSLGRWTTQEDIDCVLEELPKIIKRLRI